MVPLFLAAVSATDSSLEDRVYPVLFCGSLYVFLWIWVTPCLFQSAISSLANQYDISEDKLLYGVYKRRSALSSIRLVLLAPALLFCGGVLVGLTVFIKWATDDVIVAAIGAALSCLVVTLTVMGSIEGKMVTAKMKKYLQNSQDK